MLPWRGGAKCQLSLLQWSTCVATTLLAGVDAWNDRVLATRFYIESQPSSSSSLFRSDNTLRRQPKNGRDLDNISIDENQRRLKEERRWRRGRRKEENGWIWLRNIYYSERKKTASRNTAYKLQPITSTAISYAVPTVLSMPRAKSEAGRGPVPIYTQVTSHMHLSLIA